MSPTLALFLTLAFILFLFWRDTCEKVAVSSALWIPLAWFFITGSRFVSQWLSMIGVNVGSSSVQDGSPLDALVFSALIASGLYVLSKRRVQLSKFVRQNRWLVVFLVYCFLAILWSDFPVIAFKRWIKILGHPIMILIMLTEADPGEAVRRVLKRCGFLLIGLSFLLCKYFRQYGVAYDYWTGAQYFIGVTTAKNTLGNMCMVFGVFFFWNTLQAFRIKNLSKKLYELAVNVSFLSLGSWLLKMASSATSLATLVLGIFTVGVLGLPFVSKRKIGIYLLAGILAFAAANSMFDIYAHVVHGLGRNLTLTDRTAIWETVLKNQPDPILGVGFESFWLGDRLEAVWSMLPAERGIGEAHNGYLETYLNLGFVGLIMFVMMLIATYRKIQFDLLRRFEFGRLRMGLFIAILVYNFTEATFVSVHFLYAIFFLICIDYPPIRRSHSPRLYRPIRNRVQEAIIPA